MRCAWAVAVLVLAGCGGGAGRYQGRATWSVDLGQGVENTEITESRELQPGEHSDLLVLGDDCDLPANRLADGRLQVLATSCALVQGGRRFEIVLAGDGALAGAERLSLTLSGPIRVTDEKGTHQGTYRYFFEGQRL